ncbi:hypothetical protein [Falsirhodobacter sp. 1013]|uniref:hypothetical protein n=1 Tax=Falsirhodobacter sp. 1013 TaxID=3417566 RepID=UPI003EBA9E7C
MTPLRIASIILVLAAASDSINYVFLKLLSSIGIMVTALVSAILILQSITFTPHSILQADRSAACPVRR